LKVERVDLRGLAQPGRVRDRVLDTLLGGLAETGFVRVVGHGVDPALVQRTHALFGAFFALDEATKRRVGGVAGGQRGYTPFGVEHARDCALPDQKAFFHVGQELPAGHPLTDVYPVNVWPTDVPGLRAAALALYRELERVAAALLHAIADALVSPSDSLAGMIRHGNSILRAAHYPPVEAGADPRAMRAAPHEDINLITLLCGATDDGLELRTHDGEWLAVASHPEEIVADVGDMLARVTNGRLPATTHRVLARGDAARRARQSLPFFAHPRPECALDVLPALLAEGDAPRLPPITAQAFLEERLREIGLVS
jgi:isopenicillin N synthase-like dioxygenase